MRRRNEGLTIGIILCARTRSSRLPMKALAPISGKPMIAHIIERLKLARVPRKIVLATTEHESDNALADIAVRYDIPCFRGSESDLLDRLWRAAETHDIDVVVNASGDNPLIEPEYVDNAVKFHLRSGADYTSCTDLPIGAYVYVVNRGALEKVCRLKETDDVEIWGVYFTESGIFRCERMRVRDPYVCRSDIRLTVDTPEDLELIRRIYGELYKPDHTVKLREVIELLDRNPELAEINRHVQQREAPPIRLRAEE